MRGVRLELRLVHDGRQWIASNDSIVAGGTSLEELGENVKKAVAATGRFAAGTKVTVRMRFDYDTFPNAAWYRQYMPYYFDHLLSFEVGS